MATETLRPDAAGDATEFDVQFPSSGAHWDKVDEVSADDFTTYIRTNANDTWRRDLYRLPASSGSGTISKITVYATVTEDTGGPDAKICIKSGGTIFDSSLLDPNFQWILYSREWALNPDDSQAWEWADIDALQIGVYGHGATIDGRILSVTQVYVEIDYTPTVVPTVTTQAVTDIAPTTATGNANITDTGGENPHTRGVCWNTAGTPTTADSKSEDNGGGSYGTGAFSKSMTGLTPGQFYYVRGYAINSVGTSYGGEVSFTTLASAPGGSPLAQMIQAGLV